MREVRRAAADPARSDAIVARLTAMPELVRARTVMSFEAVPGEPDLSRVTDWCRDRGVDVVTPAPDVAAVFPVVGDIVDVVIVPGLAFTERGDRLGQGGGWYDRFLAGVRADCVTIGVCFDEQVVAAIPVEPHDVPVDRVVTPTRTIVTSYVRRNS